MRSKSERWLLGQGFWTKMFYYLHINYAISVFSFRLTYCIRFSKSGVKCPWVEISVGWNVSGVKCPWGEMSLGWNVRGVKLTWGKMFSGWNVFGVKCLRGKMSSGWNVFGVKCTGVKCSGVKCLRGEMSWHRTYPLSHAEKILLRLCWQTNSENFGSLHLQGAHCATYINKSHLNFELQLPCDSCSVS